MINFQNLRSSIRIRDSPKLRLLELPSPWNIFEPRKVCSFSCIIRREAVFVVVEIVSFPFFNLCFGSLLLFLQEILGFSCIFELNYVHLLCCSFLWYSFWERSRVWRCKLGIIKFYMSLIKKRWHSTSELVSFRTWAAYDDESVNCEWWRLVLLRGYVCLWNVQSLVGMKWRLINIGRTIWVTASRPLLDDGKKVRLFLLFPPFLVSLILTCHFDPLVWLTEY